MFPTFNPTAVAANVRKTNALSPEQIAARVLIDCNHDLQAVKLRVLAEECRRQTAKLSRSK